MKQKSQPKSKYEDCSYHRISEKARELGLTQSELDFFIQTGIRPKSKKVSETDTLKKK